MNSSHAPGESGFVAGNLYDKYRTKNPFYNHLVNGFLDAAATLLWSTGCRSILEVGAGPGDLGSRLLESGRAWGAVNEDTTYIGTDISQEQVDLARSRYTDLDFRLADACELPFQDGSFDMVIGCEVLEHLANPRIAVEEIHRVSRKHALLSVPWEPTWRVLNFMRGKYLSGFGNTPGHLQNLTRSGFRQLVCPPFHIVEERRPLPWTMLLVEKL